MRHVFISPHLDDAVFSTGDYISTLLEESKVVLIINVFTSFGEGDMTKDAKKYLQTCGYSNVKSFYNQRIREDKEAMLQLGVENYIHLGFIDAGFRKIESNSFTYPTYDTKFLFSGKISIYDYDLKIKIYQEIKKIVRKTDVVYGPLGIGKHVDHIIVKNIIKQFNNQKYYWLDQPYSLYNSNYNLVGYEKSFELRSSRRKTSIAMVYSSQILSLFRGDIKFMPEILFKQT